MVNISLTVDQFKTLTWCIQEFLHFSFVKSCFPDKLEAASDLEDVVYLSWAQQNPNLNKILNCLEVDV